MKKDLRSARSELGASSVVYEIKCPVEDCALQAPIYIGYTLNTVSKRLTYHLQQGSMKEHVRQSHGKELTRKDLKNNTRVVMKLSDKTRAQVYEALTIVKLKPDVNSQRYNFLNPLRLYSRTNFS